VAERPQGDWRIGLPFLQRLLQAPGPDGHGATSGSAVASAAAGAKPMTHDKILILDFGSQVTQLIARRVREAHVYCEIHPNDVGDAFIRDFAPKGIILSGSHASTYEEHDLRAPQAVWEQGVPVLGICYGMFTMAVQLGGQVEAGAPPRVRLRRGARAWPHALLSGIRTSPRPRATACSRCG
jgi:carbamoylphosphate synthase small subunit